jgi:hypothetical protein
MKGGKWMSLLKAERMLRTVRGARIETRVERIHCVRCKSEIQKEEVNVMVDEKRKEARILCDMCSSQAFEAWIVKSKLIYEDGKFKLEPVALPSRTMSRKSHSYLQVERFS